LIASAAWGWRTAPVTTLTTSAGMKVFVFWRIFAPAHKAFGHRLTASRQAGVGDDDAREPVGVFSRNSKSDQPAPVLTDERDLAQAERFDQPCHHVNVKLVGIIFAPRGFVRSSEARQIRRDGAAPGGGDDRDHL